MLGDDAAAACEGDACVIPTAAQTEVGPAAEAEPAGPDIDGDDPDLDQDSDQNPDPDPDPDPDLYPDPGED